MSIHHTNPKIRLILWLLLAHRQLQALYLAPFNQAMGLTETAIQNMDSSTMPKVAIYRDPATTSKRIALIRERYEAAQKRLAHSFGHSVRIPKKIHQIWLGPKPFPQHLTFCVNSCKRLHPDWEYQLWTEAEIKGLLLDAKIKKFVLNNKINPGKRSDVLRLSLLQKFGGVYLDIDFYCYKRLDALHENFDFYCGVCNKFCEINNAVIGSLPNHPLITACLDKIKLRRTTTDSLVIMSETGPYFFTEQVIKYLNKNYNDTDIVLPLNFTHPMHGDHRTGIWKEKNSLNFIKSFATPETYLIHLWAATWQANSSALNSDLYHLLLKHQLISGLQFKLRNCTNTELALIAINAVKQNLLQLVDVLGRHGVDFSIKDATGHDALHYAEQLTDNTALVQLIQAYSY